MSLTKTLTLPSNGNLSVDEQNKAEKIIVDKMQEDYDHFTTIELPMFWLFHNADGKSNAQPWQYRELIKELIKICMKPENATILHSELNGRAGQHLVSLLDFFIYLSDSDTADRIDNWVKYYNVKDSIQGDPKRDLYHLWREFMYKDQEIEF